MLIMRLTNFIIDTAINYDYKIESNMKNLYYLLSKLLCM